MGGAEGVVDEHIGQSRQGVRQARVVGGLPRLETRVLQEDHITRRGIRHDSIHLGADDSGRHLNRESAQFGKPIGDGSQAQILDDLPPRASEMAADDRHGPGLAHLSNRGQGGTDTEVVGHRPSLERDVEVRADQDAPIGQGEIIERQIRRHVSPDSAQASEASTRLSLFG